MSGGKKFPTNMRGNMLTGIRITFPDSIGDRKLVYFVLGGVIASTSAAITAANRDVVIPIVLNAIFGFTVPSGMYTTELGSAGTYVIGINIEPFVYPPNWISDEIYDRPGLYTGHSEMVPILPTFGGSDYWLGLSVSGFVRSFYPAENVV